MTKQETIRLYDADAYATEFTARVLSCEKIEQNEEKKYAVVLDRTLFFPEEGGQSPDKGTLEEIPVMDVRIKNGIILHTLCQPLEEGKEVSGKIDWRHRFYNMQQHSGEHIFSGLVHTRFGFHNVGFHLSDQIVTMDFDGVLSAAEVEEVEYSVNEAIAKNIEVQVSFPTKEELADLEYRSKIEIEGQVRIVTIPGYDVCACCAPHVHRTGEIGMLKVMSVQNYKGGVRISILCGFRALEAFREKSAIVNELANLYTCGQELLVDNITKQKANNQALKSQLGSARQELMHYKLAQIPKEQTNVVLFEKGLDVNVIRNMINELTEHHTGICAIFNGDDESGYSFVIGSSTLDCKLLAASLREKLGAKGGGSNVMIQGSVNAARSEIEAAIM